MVSAASGGVGWGGGSVVWHVCGGRGGGGGASPNFICHYDPSVLPSICCFGRFLELTLFKNTASDVLSREQRSKLRAKNSRSVL